MPAVRPPAAPDWNPAPQPVQPIPLPTDPAASSDSPEWLVSAADMMPTATWAIPAAPKPPAPPRGLGRGLDEGVQWSVTPPPLTGGFALPTAAGRSQDAQGCYDRALAELEAGRLAGAMALLRRALALAPGDAEIAGALARVMERRRG
jgi:hypothetical protein